MHLPKRMAVGLGAALCLVLALASTAQALDEPQGAVVLTVTGAIEKTNRGPFDESRDSFFAYHEKEFDRAAAFDRAMLEALGTVRVTIDYPGLAAPLNLEGPRLADLLATVGAAGRSLSVMALDGFVSEIAAEELESLEWIVALKRDGRYLGLGQRGPLWLVYRRKDGTPLTQEDELRWPWAAFFVEIK